MEHLYKIRRKDRRTSPLVMNSVQSEYWDSKTGRDIILKARQFGFSTLIDIHLLDEVLFTPNTTAAIIAHERPAIERLFSAVRFAYRNLPPELQREARQDTKYDLKFDNGSQIYVALSVRAGTIHLLHVSEVAFIKEAHDRVIATTEAVPTGGKIFFESTPNGMGGYFYDSYIGAKRGDNQFRAHFYPWFVFSEYRAPSLAVPSETWDDEERALGIDGAQVGWRRAKIASIGYDNFKQEYPEDDISCFLQSGSSAFDAALLKRLIGGDSVADPEYGRFVGKEWVLDRNGSVARWEEPIPGEKYVVGADPAEGLRHGDYSAAVVLTRHEPRVVARIRAHINPTDFARELGYLSSYYNRAIVCCERNNHGQHVIPELADMRIPQYRFRTQDRASNRISDRYGFLTTRTTKPILIDDLDSELRSGVIQIPDREILREMLTYLRNEDGSFGAAPGRYDDLVMAIALAIRALQGVPSMPQRKEIHYPEPSIAGTGY